MWDALGNKSVEAQGWTIILPQNIPFSRKDELVIPAVALAGITCVCRGGNDLFKNYIPKY